jgi:arginyl-tRNA synthetase
MRNVWATLHHSLQDAGLTEIIEGGALVIRVPGQEVPVMLRKSDGGFGYDSTDLASLKYRLQVALPLLLSACIFICCSISLAVEW